MRSEGVWTQNAETQSHTASVTGDRMWEWICAIFAKVHALTYLPVHTDFLIFFFPFWEGAGIVTFLGNENLSPGLREVNPWHIFDE